MFHETVSLMRVMRQKFFFGYRGYSRSGLVGLDGRSFGEVDLADDRAFFGVLTVDTR